MTIERSAEQPKPIKLTCSEGDVVLHEGESITLFGKQGFRLEGFSGRIREGFRGRSTAIMLVSTIERLEDWSLIAQGTTEDGRNQFEVLEEAIALSVIKEKQRNQKLLKV